mgnify:CR=1 FL=1
MKTKILLFVSSAITMGIAGLVWFAPYGLFRPSYGPGGSLLDPLIILAIVGFFVTIGFTLFIFAIFQPSSPSSSTWRKSVSPMILAPVSLAIILFEYFGFSNSLIFYMVYVGAWFVFAPSFALLIARLFRRKT